MFLRHNGRWGFRSDPKENRGGDRGTFKKASGTKQYMIVYGCTDECLCIFCTFYTHMHTNLFKCTVHSFPFRKKVLVVVLEGERCAHLFDILDDFQAIKVAYSIKCYLLNSIAVLRSLQRNCSMEQYTENICQKKKKYAF